MPSFKIGNRSLNTSSPKEVRIFLNDLLRRLLNPEDETQAIDPKTATAAKGICDTQLKCIEMEKNDKLEKRIEELEKLVGEEIDEDRTG